MSIAELRPEGSAATAQMWLCFLCAWGTTATKRAALQDFINFIPDYPHMEFTHECKVSRSHEATHPGPSE